MIRDTLDYDTKYNLDSNLELFLNHGDLESITELVSKGANPTKPLYFAIEKGHYELAKICVEQGANVNIEQWGDSALENSIKFGRKDIANLLLDNGADPKASESDALAHAANNGYFDILDRMIELGGNVREQNHNILVAAVKQSLECLKKYEALGLDINYSDNSALNKAVEFGSFETVDYLIEKGQPIQQSKNIGYDCLETAAEKGLNEKVRYLLDKGASPNFTSATLSRPINCLKNEAAKILIEAGADPTADNDNALYVAVCMSNTEIINHLIVDRKMPVNDNTREWLKDNAKNGNDSDSKYVLDLLSKRELFERLTQSSQRATPTSSKDKSQSHKRKI